MAERKILIVDYDSKSLDSMAQLFEKYELQIIKATDGLSAYDLFQSEKPDLVILEAMLPKLHGFDLAKKIEEGYDIVSGWRQKRKDKFLTRRLPSAIANWLISLLTRVKLHDYGCTLKAFRRHVIKNIKLYGEMHRFIPAIASHMGVSIVEVKVHHRPRLHGKSKYSLFRFIKVILDLLTVKFLLSYSTRPLQIFGLFGLASGVAGFILGLYLSYQRLIVKVSLSGRPLLLLAILLMVTGVQFITMGLLAEIMARAYHEASEKNIYFIREIVDSDLERKTI